MFKPFYGRCLECPPADYKLIVVKKQLCAYHNDVLKKPKKVSVKQAINYLNESLPKLKKKLDTVFSIYIRMRFTNNEGIVKCFTCSHYDHWKNLDCGHYVTRAITTLRWDVINCHQQCTQCNILKSGNMDVYAIKLKESYGPSVLELLNIRRNNKSLIGRFEMNLLIKEFEEKINRLTPKKVF